MAILLHILPNMENVIFKNVHKTTLELHFLNLETTFYSSIWRNKSGARFYNISL